jgi:UDPglucose 6-dehydrogenase
MGAPICIVGTGYVGMACVVGLAELGFDVCGYDVMLDRVERLRNGITPYRETGLEELLRAHLQSGRISFHDTLEEAAREAEIVIVAVGTPSRDDGSADLSALDSAIAALGKIAFRVRPTIVIRSTVPPGSCDALAARVDHFGEIVYAPEASIAAAIRYVRLFEQLKKPVLLTTCTNAELIKCSSNAFLALKISFANEVANLCDAVGAGADDVLRGIGYDRRIGSEFLNPGIGFGGPCFEKDVKSLNHVAGLHASGRELFSATLRVNERQPGRIIDILEDEIGRLYGQEIGVWGLAFKPGTDDIRDSLAMRIIDELGRRGATVNAYDPAVHLAPLPPHCRMVASAVEAASADALLVLTEWPQFAAIDPRTYASFIRSGVVIDGRNILDVERITAAGLRYRGVGRTTAAHAPARQTRELAQVAQ